MNDYLLCVRAACDNQFTLEVGPTQFLTVPPDQTPSPSHAIDSSIWYQAVLKNAAWTNETGEPRGDILFIVHGYNMSPEEVIRRHRRIKEDLADLGFKGVIVSFDWPSSNKTLAYLSDRHKAKITALKLVSDGIAYLSGQQTTACSINVHVLGHSTGAYIIREAFDDADDTSLPNPGWNVSQMIFAAGDVSAASLSASNSGAASLYGHCIRLTNYFSRHDEALDLSNVKRLGTAPRVGRIGLPNDAPKLAVNVDCTAYYEALIQKDSPLANLDQPNGFVGMPSHSWYFGNKTFAKDLFAVLIGQERTIIPTRKMDDGKMVLIANTHD